MTTIFEPRRTRHRYGARHPRIKTSISVLLVIGMILTNFYLSSRPSSVINANADVSLLFRLVDKLSAPYKPIQYGERVISNEGRIVHGSYSDGTAILMGSPNAKIIFHFEGDKVRWHGISNPFFGIAEVILDEERVSDNDLYSEETEYKRLYESQELAPGQHTIVIQATKQKNQMSQGFGLSLDNFEIRNNDIWVKVEEGNQQIVIENANHFAYVQFIMRKLGHIAGYFLMSFVFLSLVKFNKLKRKWYALSIVFCIGWAYFDELHQSLVPGRSSELLDVIIDCLGIILAVALFGIIKFIISVFAKLKLGNITHK